MTDKPLEKFEDLADIFMYKEDAHGIWRIPNTILQLDHQHVWSLRRMMHSDGSWILLKDGCIVAMAKKRSPFLLLAAANGINIEEDPAESYFDLPRSFWSFQTF